MEKLPIIGLLGIRLMPLTGYQIASTLDMQILVFTPKSIHWSSQQATGLLWDGIRWNRVTCPIPRAIFNRLFTDKRDLVTRLSNIIGPNRIFNEITKFDKWDVYQALLNGDLNPHLPETHLYQPRQLLSFLQRYYQVILKPRQGRQGLNIYRIDAVDNEFYLYSNTEYPIYSFDSASDLIRYLEQRHLGKFIMQAYIPFAEVDNRVFDARLIVQKNDIGKWQVTANLSRIALSYSYITNLCHAMTSVEEVFRYASFNPDKLYPKIKKLALQTAITLEKSIGHLGELSVDFGVDKQGNPWIIEVNGKPDKSLFREVDKQLYKAVQQAPLSYGRYLAT